MLVQSINFLTLFNLNINKRILFAILILTLIALTVAMFAVSPHIAFAGPATSPSACGTCAG